MSPKGQNYKSRFEVLSQYWEYQLQMNFKGESYKLRYTATDQFREALISWYSKLYWWLSVYYPSQTQLSDLAC